MYTIVLNCTVHRTSITSCLGDGSVPSSEAIARHGRCDEEEGQGKR